MSIIYPSKTPGFECQQLLRTEGFLNLRRS